MWTPPNVRAGLTATLLSVAIAGTSAGAAQPPSSATVALLADEDAWIGAQARRDVATLAPALADELVYGHASGAVEDKAAFVKDVGADAWKIRSATSSGRSARIYGDIGVVHGIVTFRIDDGVGTRAARYTSVYRRADGRWLLTSWQNTAIH